MLWVRGEAKYLCELRSEKCERERKKSSKKSKHFGKDAMQCNPLQHVHKFIFINPQHFEEKPEWIWFRLRVMIFFLLCVQLKILRERENLSHISSRTKLINSASNFFEDMQSHTRKKKELIYEFSTQIQMISNASLSACRDKEEEEDETFPYAIAITSFNFCEMFFILWNLEA